MWPQHDTTSNISEFCFKEYLIESSPSSWWIYVQFPNIFIPWVLAFIESSSWWMGLMQNQTLIKSLRLPSERGQMPSPHISNHRGRGSSWQNSAEVGMIWQLDLGRAWLIPSLVHMVHPDTNLKPLLLLPHIYIYFNFSSMETFLFSDRIVLEMV